MAEARTRTRRQRVEQKEQAIIAAAREVFQEHGFDRAKIAEIAKLAGVAEGTVYLYFENKNALLLAVAAEFYDRLTRDAAEGISDLPAVEKYLEDNLAEALLAGNVKKGKPIHVVVSDDEEEGLCFEQKGGESKSKKKTAVTSSASEEDISDES